MKRDSRAAAGAIEEKSILKFKIYGNEMIS